MDKSKFNNMVAVLAQDLRNKQNFGAAITDAYIDNRIDRLIIELRELPDFTITADEIENIKFLIGAMFNIRVGEEAITLHNPDIPRWFDSKKSEIEWIYWNAYRAMLESQARSVDIINANEKVIDFILDYSGDPSTVGPWSRKGLVMGNVQSGKTQNYLGLINKAMDSGYKVIILLGGHLNDLRKQTQERVDEGVVGRESKHLISARRARPEPIGVGKFRNGESNIHTLTTTAGDFSKPFADSLGVNLNGLSEPAIFTVKKNTSVMKSLYEWIHDYHYLDPKNGKKLNLPMLLIDDEADYASVNTKAGRDEITSTNEYIRKILSLFNRNTYVGYTATPFANIFIDPDNQESVISDDLFPRDFMVKIPVPDNYVGQDFFYSPDSPASIVIEDYAPLYGLKSNSVINEIPESLREAIRAFILVIAIRSLRGDKNAHNTMLVNISQLKVHQDKAEFFIESYRKEVFDALDSFSSLGITRARENSTLKSLEDTFNKTFKASAPIEESYADVFKQLTHAAGKTTVKAVNHGKILDYSLHKEHGLCVIVIGGHKLSRGLTLEGLSISYFTRNSKAYDTLMQMCRWFGYRPNYKDLCRLYLSSDSLDWYSFVATAIHELYKELEVMSRLEKRPSEFGLKVREHPGAMIITAKNKMGSAISMVRSQDLWGQTLRRFKFKESSEVNTKNLVFAENFIKKILKTAEPNDIDRDGKSGSPLVISNVSYSEVVAFIESIDLPEDAIGNSALINHLNEMQRLGMPPVKVGIFNQKSVGKPPWKKGLSAQEKDFIDRGYIFCDIDMRLPMRRMTLKGEVYSTHSVHLGNKDDEHMFLSDREVNNIIERTKRKTPINFDYICSEERDFPSLLIYLFAVACGNSDENMKLVHGLSPTLGYTVSLPRTENLRGKTNDEIKEIIAATRHSYQINKVYQDQFGLINENEFFYDDE